MRITSPMISNGMLLNINRNVRRVDTLYNQLSTGKQIQFPSDNPILASRALKFRTNVTETEQYQRNVAQGTSWMQVTEGGFKNVDTIMMKIRELVVQGASDENKYDDRQKIATDIAQLVKQIGTEMNVTYAGRYVFSGYRTDQPPVFEKKQDPSLSYDITQHFLATDIENASGYELAPSNENDMPGSAAYTTIATPYTNANILKLAYQNTPDATGGGTMTDPVFSIVGPDGEPTVVDCKYVSNDPKSDDFDPAAYSAADGCKYIRETGELILDDATLATLRAGSTLDATYNKHDFQQGELNPRVYFDCVDQTPDAEGTPAGVAYNMKNQDLQYEISTNVKLNINSLSKNVFTDKMYADLINFCQTMNGTGDNKGMTVNSMETLMAAGLSEDAAAAQIANEEDRLKSISQTKFNNMLGIIDKHIGNAMKEHTDLGSRMSRLELVDNRLVDDKLNYSKLQSDNEDVDYMEATMYLNSAESVYQAALQTGAKMIQQTLANFI